MSEEEQLRKAIAESLQASGNPSTSGISGRTRPPPDSQPQQPTSVKPPLLPLPAGFAANPHTRFRSPLEAVNRPSDPRMIRPSGRPGLLGDFPGDRPAGLFPRYNQDHRAPTRPHGQHFRQSQTGTCQIFETNLSV